MNCKIITTRLSEIRKEAHLAINAVNYGNSTGCHSALDVIEVHIQAIRAELVSHEKTN
jgi:hypothetical protein